MAISVARYVPRFIVGYAYAAVGWLAWSIGRTILTNAPLDLIPPDVIFMVFAAVVVPLVLWFATTVFVYVYLVLSGVVASELGRRQSRERGEIRQRNYWG